MKSPELEAGFSNIHAVLLAAGQASRYGSNKLLSIHPDSQLPLLWHVCEQYKLAGIERITVITGHWHDAICASAAEDIVIEYNSQWQSGLASSVKLANQKVSSRDALLLGLGDQAGITADGLAALCSAYQPQVITVSQYDGLLGAPAIFPPSQRRTLTLLTGDQGAGKIIRQRYQANPQAVNIVPLEEAACDIDSPSDWLD
ncbi:NTP transferase domain-containing protein [Aestuariibacter sp. GS-14]|uniref:nucleotidyltransferase family protein n=1 Tax=Aestuariibacter sp. GS-14 TaxID=2590670 RepID=UPI0015E862E3|nr:nucleotidyltransferase family protein [Aestuariibacter sp. GS-14]